VDRAGRNGVSLGKGGLQSPYTRPPVDLSACPIRDAKKDTGVLKDGATSAGADRGYDT